MSKPTHDITYEGVVSSEFTMGSLKFEKGEFPLIIFVGLPGPGANVRIKVSALIQLDDTVIEELCNSLRAVLKISQGARSADAQAQS